MRVCESNKFVLALAGRFGHVIIIPKDGGQNVLKKEIWEELVELDRIIRDIKAEYEGETFAYQQVCARWLDECFGNNILSLQLIIE